MKPVRLTRKVLSSRSLARPSDSSSSDEDTNVICLNSPPIPPSAMMQSNTTCLGHESTPPPADLVVNDQSKSFSVRVASMSREEEDNWMERRQRSIERLREKKNIRRGLTSRTFAPAESTIPSPRVVTLKSDIDIHSSANGDDLAVAAEREQRRECADVQENAHQLDVTLQKSIQGSPLMPTAPITGTDDYTVVL